MLVADEALFTNVAMLDDVNLFVVTEFLCRFGKRLDIASELTGLSLDALVPWSRWVTPEAESRRYDARFFLLALPEGQQGEHDRHETTMSMWARPRDVLEMAVRGEVFLAPPTTRTLELLAGANDVEAALALAGQQCLRPICPRFVLANEDGAPYLALPGDPSHDVRERRTEGPSRFVLRGGRFVSEEATDSPDLAR